MTLLSPQLFIGLLWLLFAFWYGWKKNLFSSFTPSFQLKISGFEVIKAFLVFILAEMVVVPALASVLFYMIRGETLHLQLLNTQEKGWFYACIIFGGFLGIVRVYSSLPFEKRRLLWKQTPQSGIEQIKVGIGAWFFVYPAILVFSQLVSLIVMHFVQEPSVDQVAVKHLKSVISYTFLFGITLVEVVLLVPFMEEFLFRGLLQNWLKQKFQNATIAVWLTSFCFALFHYSSAQKSTNIELLLSLFLLSCFLGYLYERQKSLWACMGLHGFFNFISILFIMVA